jgi:probable phosphoglycerate mutase
MTFFYLIRHAECDGVGEILWGRRPYVHLNATGKENARKLGLVMASLEIDCIYSSPLERALETAEEIMRHTGCAPLCISDALNELDFGDWTGRTVEELSSELLWQQYNAFRATTRIPGGESVIEAQERIVRKLREVASERPGQNVAVVSHAEIIRSALAYFRRVNINCLNTIDVPPCSINRLELSEWPSPFDVIGNHEARCIRIND